MKYFNSKKWKLLGILILFSLLAVYMFFFNSNVEENTLNISSNVDNILDVDRNEDSTLEIAGNEDSTIDGSGNEEGEEIIQEDEINSTMDDAQQTEKSGIYVGKKYKTTLEIYACNGPRLNGGSPPIFITEPDREYIVKKIQDDFVQIEQDGQIGWVPFWYFTEEASEIIIHKPFCKIISVPASMYLYPNAENPLYGGFKLDQGKVVQVFATFHEWYLTKHITYDCPYYDYEWIHKDTVVDYSPELAKEGYVKEGTKFTDKNGNIDEFNSEEVSGPVKIEGELNDLYKVFAPGGQHGYIRKTDFIPYSCDIND